MIKKLAYFVIIISFILLITIGMITVFNSSYELGYYKAKQEYKTKVPAWP